MAKFKPQPTTYAAIRRYEIPSPLVGKWLVPLGDNPQPKRPFMQKGSSTVYVIIIIMIVIFAVMMSGGGSSLFTGNEGSPVTDTPVPSTSGGGGISPTASPSGAWKIIGKITKCDWVTNGKAAFGTIQAQGTSPGYIEITVNGSMVYQYPFPGSNTTVDMILPNSKGFNSSPWSLKLYSDGKSTGGTYSDGHLQSEPPDKLPTGC